MHLCGLFLFEAPRSDCLDLLPKASIRNDSQIDLVCSCDPIRLDDHHADTGAIRVIAVFVTPISKSEKCCWTTSSAAIMPVPIWSAHSGRTASSWNAVSPSLAESIGDRVENSDGHQAASFSYMLSMMRRSSWSISFHALRRFTAQNTSLYPSILSKICCRFYSLR